MHFDRKVKSQRSQNRKPGLAQKQIAERLGVGQMTLQK